MNRLRDNSLVFHDYTFEHEDGFRQSNHYLHMLKKAVIKYRKANNLPIGSEFNEQFEENICKHTNKPELCMDYIPPTLMEKASAFAKASVQWAKARFKVRPEEEVARIQAICKACPEYGGESGFLRIVCKKCGCSRLKLFMVGTSCPKNPPLWS